MPSMKNAWSNRLKNENKIERSSNIFYIEIKKHWAYIFYSNYLTFYERMRLSC